MKKTYHDVEWIERARAVQEECKNIHLLSPPIVLWKAEVFNQRGKQIEEIIGKSNSYNRNGLNLLFDHLCLASAGVIGTLWQDAVVSYRNKTNTANQNSPYGHYNSDSNTYIDVGYGTTAESIDHINLATTFGAGNGENQLNRGNTQVNTSFDSATRKFHNDVARSFGNGYGSDQEIKEIGLFTYLGRVLSTSTASLMDVMIMRDLLASPITVPSAGAVVIHYNFEVQY